MFVKGKGEMLRMYLSNCLSESQIISISRELLIGYLKPNKGVKRFFDSFGVVHPA